MGTEQNQPELLKKLLNKELFGFVKATVIPPNNLLYPVLPHKDQELNKLIFGLTRMTGSWCTPEFVKAIRMGYTCEYIHAVSHFETRSCDLFSEFVRKFLKIKQEADGYPAPNMTAEEKQAYVDNYYQVMGIRLENIPEQKNEGLRMIAKLFLNSLWGKFSQNENLGANRIIRDPAAYFGMLTDQSIDGRSINVHCLSDDYIDVSFRKNAEFIQAEDNATLNIPIAAFTTCYARLRLYSGLELLGDRALYCDTDSILYVKKAGEYSLPTGSNLGDFKSELGYNKNGTLDVIREFVAMAPKSYGYITVAGKASVKTKGFRIDIGAREIICFNNMVEMVRDETITHQVPQRRFAINKSSKSISTKYISKIFRSAFDKRVISSITDKMIDTVPYGFNGM